MKYWVLQGLTNEGREMLLFWDLRYSLWLDIKKVRELFFGFVVHGRTYLTCAYNFGWGIKCLVFVWYKILARRQLSTHIYIPTNKA